MKTLILCLLLGIPVIWAKAQVLPVANPSPEATGLGIVSNIPVSLHTGTIQPKIDLLDLAEHDFHLLMNLTYSMTGCRPDPPSGWVGTSWNLNVGGVVTRTINGIPDETDIYGYVHIGDKMNDLDWVQSNGNNFLLQYTEYFMTRKDQEMYDQAPDDFYFQANGVSGRFFIGKNKEIHVVGQPNIKVEIDFTNRIRFMFDSENYTFYKIKITLDNGTVYHYGGNTELIDYSQISSLDGDCPPYANSWHLNKIVLPNGKEIKFNYTPRYLDTQFNATFTKVTPGGITFEDNALITRSDMRHSYLESIENDNFKIEFHSSKIDKNTVGKNWRKLDEIVALNKINNNVFKRYILQYDGNYLISLQDMTVSSPPHQFSYYDTHGIPSFENAYLETCRDAWGFYKRNAMTHIPVAYLDNNNERHFGVVSQPSLESTRAGVLKAIRYPTGGEIVFDYELNDYSQYYETGTLLEVKNILSKYQAPSVTLQDHEELKITEEIWATITIVDENLVNNLAYDIPLYPGIYTKRYFFEQIQIDPSEMNKYRFFISFHESQRYVPSSIDICGGLRIKNITYYENDKEIVNVYNYIYRAGHRPENDPSEEKSSGILGCKPNFEYGGGLENGSKALMSTTFSTIQLTDGSPVGYSEVTEIVTSKDGTRQGYTKYYYSNFDKYPDSPPITSWATISDYGHSTSEAHNRGKLETKEIYNEEGDLMRLTKYYYACTEKKEVVALKYRELPTVKENYVRWRFGSFAACYKYNVANLLVGEYSYENLATGVIEQEIEYKHGIYNQLVEKNITSSSGDNLNSTYKYPQDFSAGNNVYQQMHQRNIIAPVIEEVTRKKSSLIEKTRNSYDQYNGILHFSSSAKSYHPTTDHFQTDIRYNRCDSKGNLISSISDNGVENVYIWGYNYKYLVAIVENATIDEVQNITGPLESYASSLTPDSGKIDLLRRNLTSARITSYTYRPFIGVLTETDLNGRTIYYEYDSAGRLSSIYDENRKRVSSNQFHYRTN